MASSNFRLQSLICCKGAELGHMSRWTLIGRHIWGVNGCDYIWPQWPWSISRSLRFERLISGNVTELGQMLLLNISRKPYMESPTTLSHLTLSDLKRSMSRSLRFRSLISRKRAELGHMLQLNIDRKAYMGSLMGCLYFTLVTLKDQCQGHSDFEGLYLISF